MDKSWSRIRVLHDSGSFGELGLPQWELVLCLFFAWFMVFATLIKGIKSAGKVTSSVRPSTFLLDAGCWVEVIWVTATVPYAILIALMVFGLQLDGAYRGIEFYILNPNWTKLTESGVSPSFSWKGKKWRRQTWRRGRTRPSRSSSACRWGAAALRHSPLTTSSTTTSCGIR